MVQSVAITVAQTMVRSERGIGLSLRTIVPSIHSEIRTYVGTMNMKHATSIYELEMVIQTYVRTYGEMIRCSL